MADSVDLKVVVKHMVDGTLNESLCRVCLLPLGDICENVFTKICKVDQEYCIADILERVCGIKVMDADNYSICKDCFVTASYAYKFYLLTQRSEEILNYYVDELSKNVLSIEIPDEMSNDSICITLPEIVPKTKNFNYNMEGCLKEYFVQKAEVDSPTKLGHLKLIKDEKEDSDDERLVVIVSENETTKCYKVQDGEAMKVLNQKHIKTSSKFEPISIQRELVKKERKKRNPMAYRKCSKCPVRYRFTAKLKEHMKQEHNIDLFICKVCQTMVEDEQKFNDHVKMHTNVHRCSLCDMVFKKKVTIDAHLQWHEEIKNLSKMEGAYICELCGVILPNEEQLKAHYDKKHDKKYTCYYCAKMYRGELSFEAHIKKHEMHMRPDEKRQKPDKSGKDESKLASQSKEKSKKLMCSTCGRHFVDERALMWHNMLHTNERPYSCDVCGKRFVTRNRRNQHAVTAHTVPTRRCPVCPALFHLRSMVNTHIKKVHLKTHKRRNRTSKHQNVCWKTEAVPIQELSVSIQNEILEMQTRSDPTDSFCVDDPPQPKGTDELDSIEVGKKVLLFSTT